MSHVSTVEIDVNDLESLRVACKALGLEFVEGQTTYRWYGKWVQDYSEGDAAYKNGIDPKDYGKCEHAIRLPNNPNAYEVGVARRADGKLTLVWDLWSGGKGLEAVIGKNGSKLRQEYSLQVGTRALLRKGFRVTRGINAKTGKPRLLARG